jgi:DNA-binding NtrC family response regulator
LIPLVLIIDDDDGVRHVLQEALEAAGFEVMTALNGREGLLKYRNRRPDIVITDVLMPKLSGIELVHRLLAEDRSAKIIVMSGVVGAPFLEAGREIGVCRIFEKPVDMNALVLAARQLVQDAPLAGAGP